MALPCIVLHGRDAASTLSAAEAVCGPTTRIAGLPRESEDVALPAGDWGPGRRVAVDRRYSDTDGTLLVVVPEQQQQQQQQQQEEQLQQQLQPQHEARCAGIIHTIKRSAGQWSIDMRRRPIVLHMACRLTKAAKNALCLLIEENSERVIFVLTCKSLAALGIRLSGRAVSAFVPDSFVSPRSQPASVKKNKKEMCVRARTVQQAIAAIATGRATLRETAEWAAAGHVDPDLLHGVIRACARADHALAVIAERGGDLCSGRAAASRMVASSFSFSCASCASQHQGFGLDMGIDMPAPFLA